MLPFIAVRVEVIVDPCRSGAQGREIIDGIRENSMLYLFRDALDGWLIVSWCFCVGKFLVVVRPSVSDTYMDVCIKDSKCICFMTLDTNMKLMEASPSSYSDSCRERDEGGGVKRYDVSYTVSSTLIRNSPSNE